MKYICRFVGRDGRFNNGQSCVDVDRSYAINKLGPSGYTENLTELRLCGAWVHRKELDNQPEFQGYLGPMWDGTTTHLAEDGVTEIYGILRYETSETYAELSR